MNTRIPRLGLFLATLVSFVALPQPPASAQERGLVVRIERRPMVQGGPSQAQMSSAYEVELAVFSDRRATRGGVEVRLSGRELAAVRRLVGRTRFRMDRRPIAICTGMPSLDIRVTSARGAITFQTPCARPPDPTVDAMLTGVRAIVGASLAVAPPVPVPEPVPVPVPEPVPAPVPVPEPMPVPAPSTVVLARYSEERHDRLESASMVLYDDGRLVLATRTVQLAPDVITAMRARARAVTFAHDLRRPTPCAAAMEGEASFELPGIGATTWTIPCGHPSVSVGEFVSALRRLQIAAGESPYGR